jgi:hypothetical protein
MCDNKSLKVELDLVKKCSEQNNRALYGKNGEAGLIADVTSIKQTVEKIVTNDLPHLRTDLLKEIEDLKEDSWTWRGFRKEVASPIAIAIVTAVLVTVLHNIFF